MNRELFEEYDDIVQKIINDLDSNDQEQKTVLETVRE